MDTGTQTSAPDVSRWLLRLVIGSSNQNVPHRAVPGEAPNPSTWDMTVSNTITALRDHGGAGSEAAFQVPKTVRARRANCEHLKGPKASLALK